MKRVKFSLQSMIAALLAITLAAPAWAFNQPSGKSEINLKTWGNVTTPVFGTSEGGCYAGAELFAGPNKFGSYYAGVLPNGRKVTPAGTSIQVGMNPLGSVLTPDGEFLITTNNDERDAGFQSYQNPNIVGGYAITVIETHSMQVVSQITQIADPAKPGKTKAFKIFIGLQVTGNGPYTLWAAGGGDNDVKIFTISATGSISQDQTAPNIIPINPITPSDQGYVSNYNVSSSFSGSTPSGFSKSGAHITFPAGMALSPDGKWLYVACNGDDSVAVIKTEDRTVVKQVPVGYFPYTVSVSKDGQKIAVSNWGVTEYKFAHPSYDGDGKLTSLGTTGTNLPDGFYVPVTSTPATDPNNPKSSSISLLWATGGDGSQLGLIKSVYEGEELDALDEVGDTHPSATAVVRKHGQEILYVTKSNTDSLGVISLTNNAKLPDFELHPVTVSDHQQFGPGWNRWQRWNPAKRWDRWKRICGKNDADTDNVLYGAYPNAIVVAPDNNRIYVAEAGTNAVAVLDTSNPLKPELLGRIPTGWYPTALSLSQDGRYLYVTNAKGIGEDINNSIDTSTADCPTGLASDPNADSNYIFGSVQKVDLHSLNLYKCDVLENNFAKHQSHDTSIVPLGDKPSRKIKHVFFILRENKTFDSVLGNLGGKDGHFGPFGSLVFNNPDGSPYTNTQYTGVEVNTQALASKFAAAANYYSDAEESDAGHQFCASGTATDYTEKTLLVKSGRGLLVNKNFEPEDYPASGYIFNNAARNEVSFKDYGALIRIDGTDTGTSTPTNQNDPNSGNMGYPVLMPDGTTIKIPLGNLGDVTSGTSGLGQSYFLQLPVLAILGENNKSGEPHLDKNYPGYNFNISDQRRAIEFMTDFDRMVSQGTLPQFIYLYLPNDHTGGTQATNLPAPTAWQQVADNDVAMGMVVKHIMESPVYYDHRSGEGSAIFITEDDAQSSRDHIHPHRTPLSVVSPYAKPGYVATKHYSTASVVKTEELLLGLPPMNLGDLLATDLRDMFQPCYNGIKAKDINFITTINYTSTCEGRRIWDLAHQLDIYDGPDEDSFRTGALGRMSAYADDLYFEATKKGQLNSASYKESQEDLYEQALKLINTKVSNDD